MGDYLEKCKIETMVQLRSYFNENTDVDDHIDFLRSERILNQSDAEEINSLITSRKKADILLDKIIKKGGKGFDAICKSLLHNRVQLFLLEKLNKTFEELKFSFLGETCA